MFWKNLKIFHMLKKLRRNVQHSPRFVGCVVSYGVKFVSTAGGAVCQQDPAAGGGARPAAGHQQDHGRAADTGAGDTWEGALDTCAHVRTKQHQDLNHMQLFRNCGSRKLRRLPRLEWNT